MKKTVIPLFLAAAAAFAQTVPLRWAAELGDARPARFTLVRGDTVELAADLFAEGRPYAPATADASLLWQTNGMGALWWEAPAAVASNRVSATWTPAMDCGASSYLAHFRVGSSTGSVFRAYARLAMQHGPGDPVNALPLPVPVLDFDKIVVTNAPWSEGGGTDGQVVTNIVESIVADVLATNTVEEVDPVFADWKNGDRVMAGNGSAANSDAVAIGPGARATGSSGGHGGASGRAVPEAVALGADAVILARGAVQIGAGQNAEPDSLKFRDYQLLDAAGLIPDSRLPGNLARTDNLGTAAFRDASEFATAADEALVYQLLMGSNVVAEVTNYNSRVRAPSFRLLQLDPDTKEYFTVWAETNGLTRTLNEAKAYADTVWQDLEDSKAPRAWSRTTSGLGADAPAGVTWISTPETVVAGGYEYERHVTTHGEVWVLTSNGMGFGGDSNSYFRVSTPDGETLFSIEKTDEQIVGVLTDGITISGGVVTLDVGVTTYNGQAPICMAAQSVSGPWSDLSEGRPAWISSVATNGVNGAWSFELESEAKAAFFYFLVRQPGVTVIKNSAQTDLAGGILVEGTRFYPHKSGSTLTWTTTP